MVDEATEIIKETFLDIISSNYSLQDDSIVSLACVNNISGDVEACTSLLEEGISKDVMPYWSAFIGATVLFVIGISVFVLRSRIMRAWIEKSLDEDLPLFIHFLRVSKMFLLHVLWPVPSLVILGVMQLNFKVALGILHIFPMLVFFYGYYSFYKERDRLVEKYGREDGSFQIYAQNVFQDFSSIVEYKSVFDGQALLICMYIYGLYDSGPPDFTTKKIYAYYCLGIILQFAYSVKIDIFRKVQDFSVFWAKVSIAFKTFGYHDDIIRIKEKKVNFDEEKLLSSLVSRQEIDALINLFGTTYIMIGLPIQIARQSNPLDFVLNVLAAFYVIELDDLGEPKELVTVTGVKSLSISLVDAFDEDIDDLITEVEIATKTKETLTAKDVCTESLEKQYKSKRKYLSGTIFSYLENQEEIQQSDDEEDEEENKVDPILNYATEQRHLMKTIFDILQKAIATALTEISTIDANTTSRISKVQKEAREAVARELNLDRGCQNEEDEYVEDPNPNVFSTESKRSI